MMDYSKVIIDNIPVGKSEIKYLYLSLLFGQPFFFLAWLYNYFNCHLTHIQKRNLYYGTGINYLIITICLYTRIHIFEISRNDDIMIKFLDKSVMNNIMTYYTMYFIGYLLISLGYFIIGYSKFKIVNIVVYNKL